MKIEFESSFLSEQLYEELEFGSYLSLFEQDIPLLPARILQPMGKKEGLDYFERVGRINRLLANRDMTELVDLSKKLPPLDKLLPHFRAGQLEQYHLFELGTFLVADGALTSLEEEAPLDPVKQKILDGMHALLKEKTSNNFSVIAANPMVADLSKVLARVEKDLADRLGIYENRIFEETGLRMIYPWPREIASAIEINEKITSSRLLSVEQRKDVWFVDYRPDGQMQSLIDERDRLTAEFEAIMSETLAILNGELLPFCDAFTEYYQKRKERTWEYNIIAVKRENKLTFPIFTQSTGCRIKKGFLWGLHRRKRQKCIPLDLELIRGANVLYGANLSGKTTVLKTIFFIFSLIQCGLPVPAVCATMRYPESVSMLLKSSGNIREDISAFGEEMDFLSREFPDGAYIFIDELFLSTDPVNGATLSEIVIDDFANKEICFFCTTHYTEVVALEHIHLMRMQDIDPGTLSGKIKDIAELKEKMPYRLENITERDDRRALLQNKKPLEIALLFPVSTSIKEKIQRRLNSLENE